MQCGGRMKNVKMLLILAVALAASGVGVRGQEGAGQAKAGVSVATLIDPAAIDVSRVLPAPPQANSLPALADLEVVLRVQAARTPVEVEFAKFIEKDSLTSFTATIGPWFKLENLPAVAELFRAVDADCEAVSERTKKLYLRPRPPLVSQAVHPCVTVPKSGSYPSGHSTRAFVRAAVLAEIFPEMREALFARAHEIAWSRVIGGVHFPTDIVGGHILGDAIVDELKKSPVFQALLNKARFEAETFKIKKAA